MEAGTPRPAGAFVFALICFVLLGVGVTLVITLLQAFDCGDGDGGVPYVAIDSPRKDVCNATGDGLLILPVSLALIGALALVAWRFARSLGPPGSNGKAWTGIAALLLAMPVTPVTLVALHNIPSSYCSDEVEADGGNCAHY